MEQGICKVACNERIGKEVSCNILILSLGKIDDFLNARRRMPYYFAATLSIVKMTSFITVHPGISFLIKHVGTIFRKLFQV